ncbi:MAG: ATPase, T2SS/T4P/T4SS family [Acidobacteriota bacterium]
MIKQWKQGKGDVVEYVVQCWNCLGEYDAMSAVWCSCNPTHPTKVCPFCLQCFCTATQEYQGKFWKGAPESLTGDRAMLSQVRGLLGETLVRSKAITSDQLLSALKEQEATGKRLGEALVDLGYLDQETLEYFLQRQQSVTRLDLREVEVDPDLVQEIGVRECRQRKIFPVSRESLSTKDILTLAMARPGDGDTIDFVQDLTGCQVVPMQASEEEIAAAIAPFVREGPEEDQPEAPKEPDSPPGTKIATDLLRKALSRSASDLYVEPGEDLVNIHMRIDGILYRARPLEKAKQKPLTTGLMKFLRMESNREGTPQESRVVMRYGEDRFDVIAHALPTTFGDNVSIRIVNRDTFLKPLTDLGLPDTDLEALEAVLEEESGLVILSAPLFHGATTTLYAIMNQIARNGHRKVMSIESQSICPIPNVSQVALGRKTGDDETTFSALRAMAAIEPDVLVFGDILDNAKWTTQILKFASAMLVVVVMDASSCLGAVGSLLQMGVSAEQLSKDLRLVLSQHLLRKICTDCAVTITPSKRTLRVLGLTDGEAKRLGDVARGKGCRSCTNIGYKGRIALFETLRPTRGFLKALASGAFLAELGQVAVDDGMEPMRSRALEAVKHGLTTLEEFQKGNF